MLHPHVSEEVKGFAKHLFATFLGLLMALGLEQWREHRVEMRLTRESLEQVIQELRENKAAMTKERERLLFSTGVMKSICTNLSEELKRGKGPSQAGSPLIPKEFDHVGMGLLQYRMDAWETLKSVGALRHLDARTRSILAEIYHKIALLPEKQRMQIDMDRIRAIDKLFRDPSLITSMNRAELQNLLKASQSAEGLFEWSASELDYTIRKINETQAILGDKEPATPAR